MYSKQGIEMAQSDVRTRIKPSEAVKEPPMFKVIYLNDNQTTMEFVIESLIELLDYNTETAVKITEDIHVGGQATVAVLPFEIAEQKGVEATNVARAAGFPLQIKVDPE